MEDAPTAARSSSSCSLVTIAPMGGARRRLRAERDFALWHERGRCCLETFSYLLGRGRLRQAVFDLFQAAEAFYGALLLVFVGEKPWTHDLRVLRRTAGQCDPLFTHVFPEATAEDERLFALLNEACMGARYDADFSASADDLRRLHPRVLLLEALTDRLCREKLAML